MSWILDDFTEENGTLEIQNQDDGEWVTIYPKKGDIVAIQGNTYHRSGKNRSIYSRGLYACVYTESPIYLEGFYTQRFL
jgi:ectoine hydroxylase-related dioxygenase (phytanoyl-CoA dioxygenase family)